jgi:hypothetical protein
LAAEVVDTAPWAALCNMDIDLETCEVGSEDEAKGRARSRIVVESPVLLLCRRSTVTRITCKPTFPSPPPPSTLIIPFTLFTRWRLHQKARL